MYNLYIFTACLPSLKMHEDIKIFFINNIIINIFIITYIVMNYQGIYGHPLCNN